MTPVEIAGKRGTITVGSDEHPRPDTTIEALAKLKPAFRNPGTVTAGNASGVNDGAAALILASEDAVKRHSLTPRARFLGMAAAGVPPRIMGIGPVPSTKKLLAKLKLSVSDFDVIELNEAFASQSLACLRQLGIADDARAAGTTTRTRRRPDATGTTARFGQRPAHCYRAAPTFRRQAQQSESGGVAAQGDLDQRIPGEGDDEDAVDCSNRIFQITTSMMMHKRSELVWTAFPSRRWRNLRRDNVIPAPPTRETPLLYLGNPIRLIKNASGIHVIGRGEFVIKSGVELGY
jgi:hypothetical protein